MFSRVPSLRHPHMAWHRKLLRSNKSPLKGEGIEGANKVKLRNGSFTRLASGKAESPWQSATFPTFAGSVSLCHMAHGWHMDGTGDDLRHSAAEAMATSDRRRSRGAKAVAT